MHRVDSVRSHAPRAGGKPADTNEFPAALPPRRPARTDDVTALPLLAGLYFLTFASLGAYLPWLPPLLADRGFSPALIGVTLAIPSFCRAIFPPAWGWLADRRDARREIVVLGTAVGGAALCLLAVVRPVPATLALIAVFGFVNVPVGPLSEVLTFQALGGRKERYGRIRLWGSLGFIATSLGVGLVVRRAGEAAAPLAAGLPLLLAAWVASRIPVGAARAPAGAGASGARPARLRTRQLAPLLVAAALGSAAHGPYYAFFTLDLERRGVAPGWIGTLWAWAVVVEILLMAAAPRVLSRLGLVGALRWGLGLGALRWALYAAAPPVAVLAAGQALHAATFALVHMASVQLVDRLTPASRKAFGQSLLSAAVYGAGGGLGMFLAGNLRGAFSPGQLYLGAAACCLAGLATSAALRRGG